MDAGLHEFVKRDWATTKPLASGMPEELRTHGYSDSREECGLRAGMQLAERQDQLQTKKSHGYQKPKVGDLALICDFQQAKNKGKKLDARWSTLRLLELISHSGVSAHVRQLHDPPGVTKCYHFDDLLVFVSRDREFPAAQFQRRGEGVGAVWYSRDAMGETGVWSEGQRGFDLTDIH